MSPRLQDERRGSHKERHLGSICPCSISWFQKEGKFHPNFTINKGTGVLSTEGTRGWRHCRDPTKPAEMSTGPREPIVLLE